jgi:hydrogenase maturation protein HypF
MSVATPPTTNRALGAAAPERGSRVRRRFAVSGVVQGVGFRPFVWNLARSLDLNGWVCNTSGAVIVEVEGAGHALERFARALRDEAPRLARIDAIDVDDADLSGDVGFRIVESRVVDGEYQPIAPDAATCADCVADIFNPADRRYRYPFTNCTNCGPRFTIIEDVPYDRRFTTMRGFTMCAACRREYEDPADRRFHAQPIACPDCGPRLWLTDSLGAQLSGDPIEQTVAAIDRGAIVALKGLGGFQLCCDAGNEEAVERLRARKRRPAKPFAVMFADLPSARRGGAITDAEAALLEGSTRPIVLLRRDGDIESGIAGAVAPGLHELGVMLPYTPMHHLLLQAAGRPLVMTSGNVSEEPIARENDEAVQRLGHIADALLLHDRDIYARYDDSVVRVVDGATRVVRRARGLCPLPVSVHSDGEQVLALGAHLKNTFTVLKDGRAFTGPHIGDLDSPLSLTHHDEALRTYLHLFRSHPSTVAADLHPDYASTRLAERWWAEGAREVRVQHHHAHIASVLAEHGLRGNVIGVAFDGVGLGPDLSIWGGEFLVCDERSYHRAGHIATVRQPGGDACARDGWRMAVAYLAAAGELDEAPPRWISESGDAPTDRQWRLVSRLATGHAGAPISTSAGRLFDAVASLLGVAQVSTFEAEAAMRLEALAATVDQPVAAEVVDTLDGGDGLVLDTVQLVASVVRERGRGRPVDELAAVFHESLAQGISRVCVRLGSELGIPRVALSGGVFQNALLLARVETLLRERDLLVFANHEVPSNDGGISLGQALVAVSRAGEAA